MSTPRPTACSPGAASCSGSGQTLCNGVCVELNTNALHCGSCLQSCKARGQFCQQGSCQCPPGQTVCNGVCIDLTSDWQQCGACNTPCPSGKQKCVNGQCQTGCPAQQTLCNSQCVDLQSSASHCGSCGSACNGLCCAGKCYALSSTIHCGSCDKRCPVGASCNPFCRCPPGQYACDGSCVDLLQNPKHCGLCNNACPPHPQSQQGLCQQGLCK